MKRKISHPAIVHGNAVSKLLCGVACMIMLGHSAAIAQEADITLKPDGAIEVTAAQDAAILDGETYTIRPPARPTHVPRTRWQHMQGNTLWTRAALSALKDHGSPLVEMVPRDITDWCPAYPTNSDAMRRAFWVGYMSALAKYESTYKPWAVGGGGRWYGLLQILPATARGYKCAAGTGEALKSGAANLSCGIRIMTHTVGRDGVIHGRDIKWRGVSADWGPMRNEKKRGNMAAWLKSQTYCKLPNATRPKARP
ncbi:transglycosylase SLT domain-containing protein [Sulfitobacter sp. F26169L]|uniref:transglycosylase SLT domain-containing protein n=1 Tax=Sulfitobacter sp. F26169L TaxID=2996015 RepID=UPI002260BD7F|nr:transglycosylase SLT domain-containing protein [Sulfitobacter sp. F26169L]MCX7566301.1 transglycosylase SLT domain-containing protein [Sulfitobacter sp. F26169L]